MGKKVANTDFEPPGDPWALFGAWYELAGKREPDNPNAMALATAGADGMPAVRMVLLKGYDANSFTFFTNRESAKGGQLTINPNAALCFYWKSLGRQIRAEGPVSLLSDAESDAYFATRARGSQISAWASRQSRPVANRVELEQRMRECERKYEGLPVPRPSYWGGYRLTPLRIEFWQEREFRLHDRMVYHRAGDKERWKQERLYP